MIKLYLQAPFAACRNFTAGWHRPTATFLTPSCVYGLLMNVAGIETRLFEHEKDHKGDVPATVHRSGLPTLRLAIGVDAGREGGTEGRPASVAQALPRVQSIYQQLHNYPVGKDAGMPADLAKGNKNNITPVRREFLSDVRAVIHADADPDTESKIVDGLSGQGLASRYGVPFLGDNGFLVDRLEVVDDKPRQAWWYESMGRSAKPRPHTTRLTVWIDRANMSQTRSELFCPSTEPSDIPSETAWVTTGPLTDS